MHSGRDQVSELGACILGVEGLHLTKREQRLYARVAPFGFILFGRNIDTAAQVRSLCAELRDAAGHDAPILIDQEGGRVQRLRPPLGREWLPPLEEVERAGARAEDAMYTRYRLIAHELLDLGIDANCAPLVDVAESHTHPFLLNRCYGRDAHTVAQLGRAVANGLLDGGVLPVVKHMPGHGRAVVDSHFDLPTVEADPEDLRKIDFAPFKALNDLPLGMTGHLVFSAFDHRPSTISSKVMGLIRNEIGFDGLIMTDDISMKALQGDLGELSAASRSAGCDVVLHCNGQFEEMVVVADASGTLSGRPLDRAHRALATRRSPVEVDISELEAKLAELSHGRGHV
ncbi:glycoside hydrolase family 3 N-terminal domain-containing protein [Roseovarius aestuariivivens]|uniref:glycoside hydrolase family 3 N-terminal domain-containing protein n=1 Tax=Roseovarius aestuariivivens TaxID=1888910 RepID=UPI0010811406|nr:glycoside hydrolase family 3 protein [Roseovarius aestuariivivens]